jgi:hypothetical protein
VSLDTKDYGAHRFGQPGPDLALQRCAIDAAKAHPHYREAATHIYCEPVVLLEPKTFLAEIRISDELKRRIQEALTGVEHVVLVSFSTSTKMPQPLAGGGKTYDFILHPDSMEIIHFDTGTWRS